MRARYIGDSLTDIPNGTVYEVEESDNGVYYHIRDDMGNLRTLAKMYFDAIPHVDWEEDPYDAIVPAAPQIQGHSADILIRDDIVEDDPVYPRHKPEVW